MFNGKEPTFDDIAELFSPEKIKEQRKNAFIGEYLDIVNNVIDKKRDEELSKIMFTGKKYKLGDVIKTIDHYKEVKEQFEEQFRKSVTVKIKED